MHRIDHSTRLVDANGTGKDGFRPGDAVTQTPPTNVTTAWLNGVQEEIANSVEGFNVTLVKGLQTQLRDVLYEIHKGRVNAHEVAASSWKQRTLDAAYASSVSRLIYGNGQFLMLGAGGVIQTSPDGKTWNDETTHAVNGVNGGAWNGTVYCVGGGGGELGTSTDGASWTARSPFGSYTGIIYGVAASPAGKLLFCGSGGEIQYSDNDGVTWAQATVAGSFTGDFNDIQYCGDKFIAVGDGGEIQTSVDGETFVQQTAAGSYAGNFEALAYGLLVDGSPKIVAVGSAGEIQTATDGTDWQQETAAGSYSGGFLGVAHDGQVFLATGASGELQTSPDGEAWIRREPAGGYVSTFRTAVYGANRFVIGGDSAELQTALPLTA